MGESPRRIRKLKRLDDESNNYSHSNEELIYNKKGDPIPLCNQIIHQLLEKREQRDQIINETDKKSISSIDTSIIDNREWEQYDLKDNHSERWSPDNKKDTKMVKDRHIEGSSSDITNNTLLHDSTVSCVQIQNKKLMENLKRKSISPAIEKKDNI